MEMFLNQMSLSIQFAMRSHAFFSDSVLWALCKGGKKPLDKWTGHGGCIFNLLKYIM